MHTIFNGLSDQTCVFLGGPIQFAIDEKGHFSSSLRCLINSLLRSLDLGGYTVHSSHRHERFGAVDMTGKYREVCSRDYNWMLECDVFAAILPADANGIPVSTSGTAVELGWASAMGKPVVLVRDPSATYSHLVAGLDMVTPVIMLDINRTDLGEALCGAIDRLAQIRHAGDHRQLALIRGYQA